MGIIVDITPRLLVARKLRGILKELQFSSLNTARKFVESLEQEITRQQIIIWDEKSTKAQVEEAIYALPLLHEILGKRLKLLADLQEEYFGGPFRSG